MFGAAEAGSEGGSGANLDVIFPWHVSVWMRTSTVDGHSLPLGGRGIVVRAGPLAILHLDFVKRWGSDSPGFEPHRTGSGCDGQWRRCRARLAGHATEREEGDGGGMGAAGEAAVRAGGRGCRVSPGSVRRRVEWPRKKTKRAKASKPANLEGDMVRRANGGRKWGLGGTATATVHGEARRASSFYSRARPPM